MLSNGAVQVEEHIEQVASQQDAIIAWLQPLHTFRKVLLNAHG